MCTREAAAADPLLSVFLQRYHLNLLAVPRENADVGDLYVHDGHRAASPGALAAFLARPFAMPPVARGEVMAAVSGTLSNGIKASVGLGLLDGFLAAMGAVLPLTQAQARWEAQGAHTLRFKLQEATLDHVDVGRMGLALIDNALNPDHPLSSKGARHYLVTGVARARSLSVAFEDQQGKTLQLDAQAGGLGEAGVGVEVSRGASGEVVFASPRPLAFGVELYELFMLDNRVRLRLPDAALNIRTARTEAEKQAGRPQPAWVAGADNVFLDRP